MCPAPQSSVRRGRWSGVSDGTTESFYGLRYAHLNTPHNPRSASVAATGQLEVAELTEVPVFPQLPSRLEVATGPGGRVNPQDDEAFYLNVWTRPDAHNLPVIVFIHGGAWASGGGSMRWYRGQRLAAEGSVVVTLNYRIGPAGHLDSGEGHVPFTDLLLALEWVQRHIAEFGGNPDQVTLAGQSAGGWYTWALASMDEAAGLFHRAAILSAPQIQPWTRDYRRSFTQTAQQLKTTSAGENGWLNAAAAALAQVPRTPGAMPPMYLPSLDEELAHRLVSADTAADHLHVEAVYVRITHHEMSVFLPWTSDGPDPHQRLENLRTRTAGELLPDYPAPDHWNSLVAETVKLSSWLEFGRFAHEITAASRRRDVPVQFREFGELAGPPEMGAAHCLDLPFQFGNWDDWADAPLLEGWDRTEFEEVSATVRHDLLAFARADPARVQTAAPATT